MTMNMVLEAPQLPLIGKRLRQQSSRDDRIKLGFMAVIGLYLVIALGAPLFVMLSKSLSTYRFDLAAFEFQVSDETGANWGPVLSAEQRNRELGAVTDGELSTNSDGRLAATKFFPEFSFRSPVHYRIRGTTDDTAFLVGSMLEKGTEWRDYDSGTFRRVMLRPARSLGVENFATYFSTPALAQSIYNSVLMAAISTVFTVAIAFALAYGLTRSCMPLKGLFRGILTIPILVPSLLPGIALVYLFGNQGVFKDLLLGYSIYGPIGIVIGGDPFAGDRSRGLPRERLAVRIIATSPSPRGNDRRTHQSNGQSRHAEHAPLRENGENEVVRVLDLLRIVDGLVAQIDTIEIAGTDARPEMIGDNLPGHPPVLPAEVERRPGQAVVGEAVAHDRKRTDDHCNPAGDDNMPPSAAQSFRLARASPSRRRSTGRCGCCCGRPVRRGLSRRLRRIETIRRCAPPVE